MKRDNFKKKWGKTIMNMERLAKDNCEKDGSEKVQMRKGLFAKRQA